MPGMVVLNKEEIGAVLSLGFRKWAAQSIPLELEKDAQGNLLFVLPPLMEGKVTQRTSWLWNKSASGECTDYKGCSVQVLHPAAVPPQLRHHSCVLEATSPVEPLLKAALRTGRCFLDVPALKKCCVANAAPDAVPTGKVQKNGRRSILKRDRARVLIAKLFPDIDSETEQRILAGILGTGASQAAGVTEDTAPDILAGVKALDPDNAEKFSGLRSVAELLEFNLRVREAVKARGEGQGAMQARRNFTPRCLTRGLTSCAHDLNFPDEI